MLELFAGPLLVTESARRRTEHHVLLDVRPGLHEVDRVRQESQARARRTLHVDPKQPEVGD